MRLSVVITGASSGIGAALALRYARDGARLGLIGRHADRLNAVADRCRALGAEVQIATIDVRDAEATDRWLTVFDREGAIDLLFANAGISSGLSPNDIPESAEVARRVVEINVIGMLNTVQPIMPKMVERGSGTIVLMGSLASFVALPQMPSYSASKSAVLRYGLALRSSLAPHGVRVNVVCPGYVDSPMTDQVRGPTPMLISADDAAGKILAGIARNRAVIAFPWLLATFTRALGYLPDAIQSYILSKGTFRIAARD